MMVLVSYDVATSEPGGARRLRRVAKICTNHGQRVQFSVFECIVDPAQWVKMRQHLISVIDESLDSFRFYFLGAEWRPREGRRALAGRRNPSGPRGRSAARSIASIRASGGAARRRSRMNVARLAGAPSTSISTLPDVLRTVPASARRRASR